MSGMMIFDRDNQPQIAIMISHIVAIHGVTSTTSVVECSNGSKIYVMGALNKLMGELNLQTRGRPLSTSPLPDH